MPNATRAPAASLRIDMSGLVTMTSLSLRTLRRHDSAGAIPGRETVGRAVRPGRPDAEGHRMSRAEWVRVRRGRPCPVCGEPDWCSVTADGSAATCMRLGDGCSRRGRDRNGQPYFAHRLTPEPGPGAADRLGSRRRQLASRTQALAVDGRSNERDLEELGAGVEQDRRAAAAGDVVRHGEQRPTRRGHRPEGLPRPPGITRGAPRTSRLVPQAEPPRLGEG